MLTTQRRLQHPRLESSHADSRCAELAALVFIAALLMPTAISLGEAGDDCGAAPQAGTITVAAGTISCPDATAVVNRYLTDPSLARDGEWVHFDGWDCSL